MRFWTLESLASITAGRWARVPDDLAGPVAGVSIDTRAISKGDAFVAIVGPRFDGHEFLDQAIAGGASLLIVTSKDAARSVGRDGPPVLCVGDAVVALQQLAQAYRGVLEDAGTKVIAVTGSNGKTTTRHMIHTLLSVSSRGTQSPRSFNNHFGVPLTMLAVRESDDFVVVEVGTNSPGEIDALARIVRPDAAVITNVGPAHLEGFGSVENVAKEKATLLDHARELVVVPCPPHSPNVNPPPTAGLLDRYIDDIDAGVRVLRFGFGADPDVRLGRVDQAGDRLQIEIEGPGWKGEFELPVLGRHNAMNFAAAYAVARWVDGKAGDAAAYQRALGEMSPISGRLETRRVGTLRIIHDAYNANPTSVAAAIETLAAMEADRRVLVLGDMLELGKSAVDEHRRLGELIAETKGIHHVILVGELCRHTADALARTPVAMQHHQALDDQESACIARQIIEDGRGETGEIAVLLKASRGLALERVVEALMVAGEQLVSVRPEE